MKKIISILMIIAVLSAALAVGTNAAATPIFSDNFDYSFSPGNWMLRGGYDTCAYIWDHNNGYLYGADDATILQSNYTDGKMWSDCYYSIDVRLQKAGLSASKKSSLVIRYEDFYETLVQYKPLYFFTIIVQTGEVSLTKEFYYTNEYGEEDFYWVELDRATLPAGSLPVDSNADWFNIGMRVTKGKIQCYFNEELILESVYKSSDEKLGRYNCNSPDSTVGTQKHPFLFYSYDNVLNLDNFQVLPGSYNPSSSGDATGDGKINLADVSLMLKYIAKWDVTLDTDSADVTDDGKVNLADVSLLLKYIAKWDVVLK